MVKSKDNNKNDKKKEHVENIFEIMDGIIQQLNNTKRLFILMIVTIMIIPPIAFIASFQLLTPSSSDSSTQMKHSIIGHGQQEYIWPFGVVDLSSMTHTISHAIPSIIGLIWLVVGIRQWIMLSQWNKRYQRYKELQKKIDEIIGNEDESNDYKYPEHQRNDQV